MTAPDPVTSPTEALPVVRHKGPNDTDASMFAQAARNLDAGFDVGGSNVRDAVRRLILREIARAALASPDTTGEA